MKKYAALALVIVAAAIATGAATTGEREVVIGHVYGPAVSDIYAP